MIRNVLIAIYILAVLAISAVARAQFVDDVRTVSLSSSAGSQLLGFKVMVAN